jgi:hypothetical protein
MPPESMPSGPPEAPESAKEVKKQTEEELQSLQSEITSSKEGGSEQETYIQNRKEQEQEAADREADALEAARILSGLEPTNTQRTPNTSPGGTPNSATNAPTGSSAPTKKPISTKPKPNTRPARRAQAKAKPAATISQPSSSPSTAEVIEAEEREWINRNLKQADIDRIIAQIDFDDIPAQFKENPFYFEDGRIRIHSKTPGAIGGFMDYLIPDGLSDNEFGHWLFDETVLEEAVVGAVDKLNTSWKAHLDNMNRRTSASTLSQRQVETIIETYSDYYPEAGYENAPFMLYKPWTGDYNTVIRFAATRPFIGSLDHYPNIGFEAHQDMVDQLNEAWRNR